MAIARASSTFNFEKTYQCGNEEANVGNIVIKSAGYAGHRRGRVHLPGQRRGSNSRHCGPTGNSTRPRRAHDKL